MGILDFLKNKKKKEQSKDPFGIKKEFPRSKEIPSLESRLKNCVPSQNGLFPHELLMLSYAHTFKQSNNTFQGFWEYKYSVIDPQKVLNSLEERGFIVKNNLDETLSRTKVSELKELLKTANEKTTGKKEELISRLKSCYSISDLEKMFPDKYYKLTSLGENELSQNEYVYYSHQHSYLSIWEMNQKLFLENHNNLSYRDIIWGELNKQSLENMKNGNLGDYRCTHLSMHDFLLEEEKYNTALHLLVEVASYDLSGLGNNENYVIHNVLSPTFVSNKMANLFFDDENQEVILPPGIINNFFTLKKLLSVGDREFIEKIYEEFNKFEIYNRIFSPDESANILLSLMGLEKCKLKNSCEVAKKRIEEIYKV